MSVNIRGAIHSLPFNAVLLVLQDREKLSDDEMIKLLSNYSVT